MNHKDRDLAQAANGRFVPQTKSNEHHGNILKFIVLKEMKAWEP